MSRLSNADQAIVQTTVIDRAARYADGEITFPAYLYEELKQALGLEFEAEYLGGYEITQDKGAGESAGRWVVISVRGLKGWRFEIEEDAQTECDRLNATPGVSGEAQPSAQTRFQEFDDSDHPANKWWQEHGQYMMSGGGRRQFIWACRGWIAREQLYEGVPVTGDSLCEKQEKRPFDAGEAQPLRIDCDSEEGIAIGLIDSIISCANSLKGRRLNTPAILQALLDMGSNTTFQVLLIKGLLGFDYKKLRRAYEADALERAMEGKSDD